MTKYVYLAGPIGNVSLIEASLWREKATRMLRERGVDVKNPLDWEVSSMTPQELVQSDLDAINQCDVLLAYCPYVMMMGTPMEMVYARGLGIPVVSFGRYKSPWKTVWSNVECQDIEEAIDAVMLCMPSGEITKLPVTVENDGEF